MNLHNEVPQSNRKPGRILPSDFFSNDAEKTKLNWFCFEYALELQFQLKKTLKIKLREWFIDDRALAEFCIDLSKHMKTEVLAKLRGEIEKVRLNHTDLEKRLSSVSDRTIDKMLTIAAEAWDHHTESCTICSTRCVSDRDSYCVMFDERYYYEEQLWEEKPAVNSEPPTGRNDLCPCGSGKKFKKCCGG